MKTIRLDFVKVGNPFLKRIGLALFVATFVLNAFLIKHLVKLHTQTKQLDSELVRFERSSNRLPIHKEPDATQEILLADGAGIMGRLNAPWPDFFNALEAALVSDLYLLTVSSAVDSHVIQITGETNEIKKAFEFADKLEKREAFSSVKLVDYQKGNLNGNQNIKFTVTVKWLNDVE